MPTDELLYLSKADVKAIGLTMAEIIAALETTFKEKGAGRTEMPPKPGIHPGGGDNFIHAMPAYIPAMQSAGVKWVSGFPENFKKGLPYIAGLLIFNDTATGMPLAVMDCIWITAMRTGAATALSAKFLARPESSTVGVLGCGVQGRTNVEALKVLFPLQKVRAYDVDAEVVRKYAQDIGTQLDLEVVPVKTPQEAVTGCDLIVTAGPILKTTMIGLVPPLTLAAMAFGAPAGMAYGMYAGFADAYKDGVVESVKNRFEVIKDYHEWTNELAEDFEDFG